MSSPRAGLGPRAQRESSSGGGGGAPYGSFIETEHSRRGGGLLQTPEKTAGRGPRAQRLGAPSPGFCLIVVTYTFTLAFFAWGLQTPPLDRVWQLHHQLKTGDLYALGRPDRELLAAALARHGELAEALLPAGQIGIISAQRDGWIDTPVVTLIRTPKATATRRILLEVQTPSEHLPFRVSLEGSGWRQEVGVQQRGVVPFELPPPGPVAELLTLKLEGPGLRADPSSLGARLSFDPPGRAGVGSEDADDEEREEAAE